MPRDTYKEFDSTPVVLGTSAPQVFTFPLEVPPAAFVFERSARKNGSSNRPGEQNASFVPEAKLTFLIDQKGPDGSSSPQEIKAIALCGNPHKPHSHIRLVVPDAERPSGMRTVTVPLPYDRALAAVALNQSGPVDLTQGRLKAADISSYLLAKGHAQLADSVWPKTPKGKFTLAKPLS